MINKQSSIIDSGAIQLPENYSVSIEISGYSLAIVLYNKVAQKFTAFESWLSDEKNSKLLFEKISESQILKTKYSNVRICLLNGSFVHIPAELFIAEEAATYLNFTVSAIENGKVLYSEIPLQKAFCCFLISEGITDAINQAIQNTEYIHFSSAFISKILLKINSEQKSIVVFFHENAFEIACVYQQKLINYNSFSFQTIQEYLYFILLFLQQSNLDTETVNCFVYGGIEENSALMQGTLKYIRNVELFRFTDDNLFSDVFDAIPKNRYDMLFQNALNK